MGSIKLTVSDTLEVMPDTLVFNVTVTEESRVYDEVIKNGTNDISKVKTIVSKYELDEDCLRVDNVVTKPVHHNVYKTDKRLFGETQTNGVELVGYEYKGYLKISLPLSRKDSFKVYVDLINLGSSFSVIYEYILSDVEAAKDKLLENLTKKANRKAQIIARASGRALGELINVSQQVNKTEVTFQSSSYYDDSDFDCDEDFGAFESVSETMFNNASIKPVVLTDTMNVEFAI